MGRSGIPLRPSSVFKKKCAVKIRKLRKENAITQKELAEKIGCSEKTVSKWERASSIPDIEILLLLAKIFHVSVESLFQDEENIYFLGIDGGGTKTQLILTDSDGNVVKNVCAEGCNPIDIGIDKAKAVLRKGIYEVCENVDVSSVVAFAGIAGGLTKDEITLEYFMESLENPEKYDVKILDKVPAEGALLLARQLYENTKEK